MAEAVVLMLLERLAPKIEKMAREEFRLALHSEDEVQKLSSRLQKIQQVVMDAEQKAVLDPQVRGWLDKLQDISYDIDDVLDEWDLSQESGESSRKKVSSYLQFGLKFFKQSVERYPIARNIHKLNMRLDSISEENENEFKFIPNLTRDSQEFKRIASTSILDVSQVHGRDDDLISLTNKLVSGDGVQILSLVGAGGIGKTTLAQLAFNHDSIKLNFEERIWVCVSDPFDEIKIAKAILESVNKTSPNLSQFETLVQCIKDYVLGKRFLLVLDDVWTEDDTMWKPLRTSLTQSGAPGSKILLTTRNRKVSEIMGSDHIQSLHLLSDRHCWSTLNQIAFQGRDEGDCEMLKETGWKIALKCKGLPLAAKALGSLLRFKSSLQEWQNVLNSDLWAWEKVRTKVFPFLALTYNDLHPVAKRCFSYCALFPKDSCLDVEELIRSWMANGFIYSSETGDEMEIKGRDVFNNLANRSFFQDFEEGSGYMDHRIVQCKMHDIVHDFAQFLTKGECLIVERPVGEANRKIVSNKNVRHLNLLGNEAINWMDLLSICQTEKLSSFLCQRKEISPDCLSYLKRVRWLSLQNCKLADIPGEIGDLVHIRYLDLSFNPMKELPESICCLYKLQVLNIIYCSFLSQLPRGIDKLKNLRHLLIIGCSEMFVSQGVEKLHNLREFDYFCCKRQLENKLGSLKNLNQLTQSLVIEMYDLDDSHDHVAEAKAADLKKKKFIHHLALYFGVDVESDIIDALQPSPNLPCLKFMGTHLPNWVTTLTNLRKLYIERVCNGIQALHSLRNLPFLEELALDELKLECLSLDFLGIHDITSATTSKLTWSCELLGPSAFPKLKELSIYNCERLKEWEDIGEEVHISILPCLEVLRVYWCPELRALPHRLLHMILSLQVLDIRGCVYLKGTGEDGDRISHIQHVHPLM